MKRTTFFIYSFYYCISFCLLSCSSDEQASTEGQPLSVQAEIASVTSSGRTGTSTGRADTSAEDYPATIFNKTFTEGDVISISASGSTSTSHNYTYNGTSLWLPSTDGLYFTVTAGETTTYTATYPPPAATLEANEDIPEDQTRLTNFQTRYYQQLVSPAIAPTSTNQLAFTGENALHPTSARITIHVSYPEERTPVSVTLTGKGIRTGNTGDTGSDETIKCLYMNRPNYDFSSTGTSPDKAKKQSWTALIKDGVELTYTITIKCTVTDSDTDASPTEAEKTGTYTQTTKKLSAGTNYIYNFSFSDYPKLEGATVEDYPSSSGSPGDIDAGSAH